MKKKLILGLAAVVVVVAGVAAMSAYEAHVINVTAHIENALYVHPDEIAFGTVFPQEYVKADLTVQMSESFELAERVDDIEYVIKQKPKCACDDLTGQACPLGEHAPVDYATHECPELYHQMENLCPFLSKMDADDEDNNDTSHPSYYNDNDTPEDLSDDSCVVPERFTGNELVFSSTGWGGHSCPAGMLVVGGGVIGATEPLEQGMAKPGVTVSGATYPNYPHYTYAPSEEGWVVHNGITGQTMTVYADCIAASAVADATGRLAKSENDWLDLWTVDLKVPPVEGYVGQDWPAGCPTVPKNDIDYGCDLWIEVTNISESVD